MDDNGILGVKMNGLSFQINELSIDDDQQNYDYICNIVSTGYCFEWLGTT